MQCIMYPGILAPFFRGVSSMSNLDKLKELQKEVKELLRQSKRFDYLETGDCLDVLRFAHEMLPEVIAEHKESAA
jgi:hypothetical protein